MKGILGLVSVGAFLLLCASGVQAQTSRRDGDTWDGQRHPPTAAQLKQEENAAAVAAPRSEAASEAAGVDQIYRQLMELEHQPA